MSGSDCGCNTINGQPVADELPVEGGSGRQYASIEDGLIGETATTVVDTTQAGTTSGSITGSGALSAVDDFYKDWWVVMRDTSPASGTVYRAARVSSYVGATKVLTLDQPWSFGVGESYAIIDPVRLWLKGDLTESPIITKPLELNLEGHRLQGQLDIDLSEFTWVRGGSGWITDGIDKQDVGYLRLDEVSVSRTDSSIYALLFSNNANRGRIELYNCKFYGVVASRSVLFGWTINNCHNMGVAADGAGNTPYRLMETVGNAVVFSSLDVSVDGELSGAVFYSEGVGGSITGSGYLSLMGRLTTAVDYYRGTTAGSIPRHFSIIMGVGAATCSPVINSGTINFTADQASYRNTGSTPAIESADGIVPGISYCHAFNFTGTMAPSSIIGMTLSSALTPFAYIMVDGTATMSGSVTMTQNEVVEYRGGEGLSAVIWINAPTTGTVAATGFGQLVWADGISYAAIMIGVSQTAGAPTVTMANVFNVYGATAQFFRDFSFGTSIAVSVGTWTISGALQVRDLGANVTMGLTSVVSGGTFLVSGNIQLTMVGSTGGYIFTTNASTGGTLTYSGPIELAHLGRQGSTWDLCLGSGTASSTTFSNTIRVRGTYFTGTVNLYRTTAAATISGAVTVSLFGFEFEAAVNIVNASAGATITAPSTLNLDDCVFRSTLTDGTGAGTITWAAATWTMRNCHVEDLWTFLGTRFTTVQTYETMFAGNSGNKSIAASGTRPTTYRHWRPSFRALINDLKPEVIREWSVRPNDGAAIAQGQPLTINAAANAVACAATSIIDGISIDAPGGAGTPAVLVTDGDIFVSVNGAVLSGDWLVLDLATPTQGTLGAPVPGQNIGRALEAAGATIINKAYSKVLVS